MGTQTLSRSMTFGDNSLEHWDESEFRVVFLRHYARIVTVLLRLIGDLPHAEEIANDAFWRLYRQPALQGEDNVGGWLYRTATNLGIDALRASGRRRRYEEAAAETPKKDSGGPLDDVLRDERCRRVRAVLASIKPAQAQLLVLRSSGFSYKELAIALDVKMSGIGTMLNRAEEEFRKRYLALYQHEEEV